MFELKLNLIMIIRGFIRTEIDMKMCVKCGWKGSPRNHFLSQRIYDIQFEK